MTSVSVYNGSDSLSVGFMKTLPENGKLFTPVPRMKEGLAVTESGRSVKVQTEVPHLVSLGSGRLSTAITIHALPKGRLFFGTTESPSAKDIVLQGSGIVADHCFIENDNGVVTIYPQSGAVSIDSVQIIEPARLSQGCMLCLGRSNFFRFNNPKEARLMKEILPTARKDTRMKYQQSNTSSSSFMDSVDFVEKVSKFEYLAHAQLPPLTSQDTPKWFVKEGVRIPQVRGPKCRSPGSENILKKPGFSTPPPYAYHSSHGHMNVSPMPTRLYSKTPDPVSMSSQSSRGDWMQVSTPVLSGCNSHHVSAENLKACEFELEEQHRKAVQERLKDEEQERQERMRLEEILHLCAEYEEQVQQEKHKKSKFLQEAIQALSSSSGEFSGSSEVSAPESSNSEVTGKSDSNTGYTSEEIAQQQANALQQTIPIKVNGAVSNHVVIPSRIKTNGSLPRDRSFNQLSPSNDSQTLVQSPTIDYSGNALFVNHKALNSASSEDELCAILGSNTIQTQAESIEEQAPTSPYFGSNSRLCPQSPRTRIRTVAGLPDKGPEIYENKLALSELSKDNDPNVDIAQTIPVYSLVLGSGAFSHNHEVGASIEVELLKLQKERQECLQAIGIIKQKVSELDIQKTEFLNEHGLEHALIAGELKEEEERQALESSRIAELQTRKMSLEQEDALTQEEIDIAKQKVLQKEKIAQDLQEEIIRMKTRGSSSPLEIEAKTEQFRAQVDLLELEKKAFEDMEFQQLESQAHREEEKEALAQEMEHLKETITQRQERLNDLALQKLKLVSQLEQEKYNFECAMKICTEDLQKEVIKLQAVSDKVKSATSMNLTPAQCFSDESSPRTSDSEVEMQRNGIWNQAALDMEGNVSPRYSGDRSENCNSFHSFESESSSLASSDTGCENGRRQEDQIKPLETTLDPNKVLQREQMQHGILQEQKPLVNYLHENGNFEVKRREKPKAQRPLTRYLPVRNSEFDLRLHIESAGHQIELCPHIHLTSSSCHGYLHKLGGKWRTWKKRWFVFDRCQRVMLYYNDKSQTKLKGGIYFQAIEEVYVDHLHSVKSPSPHSTFCVKTYDRVYYLMAPTPESMRIWVDVIFTGAEGYLDFIAEGE